MQQYPCSFEFNDKLLQMLFENAYSSNYGERMFVYLFIQIKI